MSEARCTDLHAIRLVAAVGHHVDAELALRMLHRGIGLTGGNVHALGEQLEVVDEIFHTGLHAFPRRWGHLVVLDNDGTGIVAQPFHTLANDSITLAHFRNAAEITVVAIAVDPDGDVEFDAVVDFVGLVLAEIPFDTGATQHGAGKAHCLGKFRRHNTDIDQTLLPDAVIGEQGFVFVYTSRETVGEVFNEVEQRTGAGLVHEADFLLATVFRVALVLGHGVGKIAVDTTRAVVSRVHAGTGDSLVDVHEIFTLTEGIEEHGHGTDVQRMRTQRHEVIQDTGNFVEHYTDVLRPQGNLNTQQPLDSHDISVFVTHHGHVVETIHVRQCLQVGTMLGQFFSGTMQQPNVRVCPLDDFAVHFQHETQHAVGGRVLGTKVQGVVFDFSHAQRPIP